MRYLALNQQQLKRFSYHWFWGLSAARPGLPTFYELALELDADKKEVQEDIVTQHERISRRGWFMRGFYWLFNVNQYRFNYYKLQSYICWQLYEEGRKNTMLSQEALAVAAQVARGFLLSVGVAATLRFSNPYLTRAITAVKPSMPLFLERLTDFFPIEFPVIAWPGAPSIERPNDALSLVVLNPVPSIGSAQVERTTPRSHFVVVRVMLDALNTLGLARNVGTEVSFVELKSAYRARIRRTHPDKTMTDSKDDFIAAHKALTLIVNEAESLSSSDKIFNNIFSEFTVYFTNLGGEGNEQRIIFRELAEQENKFQDLLDNLSESLDELEEREALRGQKISEYCQKADIYCQKADIYSQEVHMFCQETGRMRQEIKEAGQEIYSLRDKATMLRQEAEALDNKLLRLCEEAEEKLRVRQAKLAENDILPEIDADYPDPTMPPIHEAPSRSRSTSPKFFDEPNTSSIHNALLTEAPNHGSQANM